MYFIPFSKAYPFPSQTSFHRKTFATQLQFITKKSFHNLIRNTHIQSKKTPCDSLKQHSVSNPIEFHAPKLLPFRILLIIVRPIIDCFYSRCFFNSFIFIRFVESKQFFQQSMRFLFYVSCVLLPPFAGTSILSSFNWNSRTTRIIQSRMCVEVGFNQLDHR